METKLNVFSEDLKFSEAGHAASWWEPYYRRAFPTLRAVSIVPGPSEAQRAGIDKVVTLQNGKRLLVDEKLRRPHIKPDDIALEYLHKGNGQTQWLGWIEKPSQFTDYLVVGFSGYQIAFFFPFLTLQFAWLKHKDGWLRLADARQLGFSIAKAQNKDYVTLSCCVPTERLFASILDAIRVQL